MADSNIIEVEVCYCREMEIKKFWLEMGGWLVAVLTISIIPLDQTKMNFFGAILYLLIGILMIKSRTMRNINFGKNLKETFGWWLGVTLLMIVFILLLKIIYPEGVIKGFCSDRSCLLNQMPKYVLLSATLQELVFRGYFFERVRKLFSTNQTILITSIIFGLFHLPYLLQLKSILFYLSLGAGLIWGVTYAKKPNMIWVMSSHAIVGGWGLWLLQRF